MGSCEACRGRCHGASRAVVGHEISAWNQVFHAVTRPSKSSHRTVVSTSLRPRQRPFIPGGARTRLRIRNDMEEGAPQHQNVRSVTGRMALTFNLFLNRESL